MGLLAAVVVGSVAQWITLGVIVGGAYFYTRGGGSDAMAILRSSNEVLTRRIHDLQEENKALTAKVAELSGKTDVVLALQPVATAVEEHEARAAERHTKTLTVLDLVAQRLGPDNGER